MNLASLATTLAEKTDLPDPLIRAGIAAMVSRSARGYAKMGNPDAAFAAEMAARAVALHTDAANAQHYELPARFFENCLGRRRKYSSCYYPTGSESLDVAEAAALHESVTRVELRDGQDILELGCGWGSLTLYMAERFPSARITAVSNSRSQRLHIEAAAASRRLTNVRIITADMNVFNIDEKFDRVVSVEMFEHMSNWRELLGRVRGWLRPEGRLFLHVFSHVTVPYWFDHENGADWIAQHFFTGGLMPSHTLIRQFGDIFQVEDEDFWPGTHYARTANQWLENFDARQEVIMPILRETYGTEAETWRRRWRLFFLAVAGLWGHAEGKVWGVSQYRLKPQ